MEYTQMTLTEWVDMKQKLRQELLGVKQSFVRIGYALRKIDDQRLYEQDGYKSIAEFAKAEYGLENSTVSRFMSINREYSIDGYSERLRPEYLDLGRSQLEEMLKLPDSDRQMIRPETPRDDIRELKRFNKEEPAAGEADDLKQLLIWFYQDNPEALQSVIREAEQGFTDKRLAELVNPSGNRSYRKGVFFLMMYEDKIAVKKFGSTPYDMTWGKFRWMTLEVLEELAESVQEPEEPESHTVEAGAAEGHTAVEKPDKTECSEPTAGVSEPEVTELQRTEIAPAQKPAEIQEKSAFEEVEKPVENVENEVENLPENTAHEEEIEGQDNIEEHPEWLPEGYEKTEPVTEEENVGDREPLVSIKENIGDWRLLGQAKTVFAELKQNMVQRDYKKALETARKLVEYLEQIGTEEVPE